MTPPQTAASDSLAIVALCVSPGSRQWTWPSISPGNRCLPAGAEVVDLAGKHLLPGLIDGQVHCREPGLTHKATIASESLAAVCGGVTSFLEMPNTTPPTTDRAALAAKKAIAAATCHTNYGFYLGATNTNLDEIRRVGPGDACGIKVFMGASTGNMLVDDPATLESIFREARLPVATHCEDTPMIREAERLARERFGDAVPMSEHPKIRSAEACYKSSSLAVGLARRHGTRLHVLHLTTARELSLFEAGPSRANESRRKLACITSGTTIPATPISARGSSAIPRSRRRPIAARCGAQWWPT